VWVDITPGAAQKRRGRPPKAKVEVNHGAV
jgi:hypothetical protein